MDHGYRVTGSVIGCAINVHKALGPGLKESVYHKALCAAFVHQQIAYQSKRSFPVSFSGVQIGIVEGTVVVEIKAVTRQPIA